MADDNAPPPPPPAAAPPPPPPEPAKEKSPAEVMQEKEAKKADKAGANIDNEAGISVAKAQDTSGLGQQVHPDTQTSEADGHRTLANPVTDPGPYVPEGGMQIKHPDRSKGQATYASANPDAIMVMQRQSTGHDLGYGKPDGETHKEVEMAPDLVASGAASDTYHPVGGKTLTEQAQQLATQPRDPAPVHE